MGSWLAGNLHEPTPLEEDPVPVILLKDLKVESRPLDLCDFGPCEELQVDGKGEVETIEAAPVLVSMENGADSLGDGLPVLAKGYRQLYYLSSAGERSSTSISSGSSVFQPWGRVSL